MIDNGDRLYTLPESLDYTDALTLLMRNDPEVLTGPSDPAEVWPDAWELLAPVPVPASLRDCVGFLQHIRNTRASRGDTDPLRPVWHERPGFYFANPRSLRSATDSIAIPAGSKSFDFELEIAVVLGAGGRDLTPEDAGRIIAGYVLFCDWSARDIQAEERAMQIGFGKAKDSAISLGPWILSAAEAAQFRTDDGLNISVSGYVNGQQITAPGTRYTGMDWTFEEIVSYVSLGSDVAAGDVIAAGTVPTGCLLEHSAEADFRGYLGTSDEVHLSAGPLGDIVTLVTAGSTPRVWQDA